MSGVTDISGNGSLIFICTTLGKHCLVYSIAR